jgi:hypothetical protein
MNATTVNEISPVVMFPFSQDTTVNTYEENSQPNGYSLMVALMHPGRTVARDILQWSQKLHSIKDIAHVYVSSSHLEVLNKIARLRALIPDWDKGFKAPSMKTVANALEIAALLPKKFPVAKICLSSDGDISLELIKGKKHAVIDIDEENEFSYAYFLRGNFLPGKDKGELPLNRLPGDLLAYFSS